MVRIALRGKRIVVLEVVRPAEGGIRRHILDLVSNLDRDIFEVHVACPADAPFSKELLEHVAGIWTVTLTSRSFSPADIPPIVALAAVMRRIRPDIVHLHGFKAGVAGRLAGLLVRRPKVVYTLHNSILGTGRGWLLRGIATIVERALAARTTEVIAVSFPLVREYLGTVRFPAERVTCIHNGIDPATLAGRSPDGAREGAGGGWGPESGSEGVGKPLIGTCARLIPSKGIRFFIEAVPEVLERFPDVRFAIIGDGPERPDLETLAAGLGVSAQVLFMGYRPDARYLIGGLSLFVLPTLSEGGVPIAMLEAMAQGVPVIASNVGGVPDAVEDGVTGRLVGAGDAAGLSCAMCELLGAPVRARSMAEAARALVLREFTVDKMVRAAESIYKRAVCKMKE